jgi:DNA invertase Pin-like site-specific DNA recombinase
VRERGERKLRDSKASSAFDGEFENTYSEEEGSAASILDPRIVESLKGGRRILLWMRHSDPTEAETADGSREDQLGQIEYLRPYGITLDHPLVDVIFAAGETATKRELRAFFEFELMGRLEAGTHVLLLANEVDRVSRNMMDGLWFIEACQKNQVLVIVQGQILDPRTLDDEHRLYELFVHASWESGRRNQRLQRNRARAASKGRMRRPVPTGLIHACPADPLYRARLRTMAKELDDPSIRRWISKEQLATHQSGSELNGSPCYVLPYPDAEVYRSVQLRIEWLLECGSLRQVQQRINTGYGDWPKGREGKVPVMHTSIFRHTNRVVWKKVSLQQMRNWFRCPGLYGIYGYHAKELEKGAAAKRSVVPLRTFNPKGFPSFASFEDGKKIEQLLHKPRNQVRGRDRPMAYRGARNFAFPAVQCSHVVPDHGPCKLKLSTNYLRDGTWWYQGTRCFVSYNHPHVLSPLVEHVVLEVLLEVVDPERVRTAVKEVHLARGNLTSSVKDLERKRDQVKAEEQSARSLAIQWDTKAESRTGSKRLDALQERDEYQTVAQTKSQEARQLEGRLRELQIRRAEIAQTGESEINELFAMAGDLRRLITEARAVDRAVDAALLSSSKEERQRLLAYEGRLREVIRATDIQIRTRPLPDAQVELEVVFPSGDTVTRVLYAQYAGKSQVERLWAWHHTRVRGRSPEEVAAEMTLFHSPHRLNHTDGWTPGLVRAAALHHEMVEHIPAPERPTWSISALASRTGETEEAVMKAAFSGRLGPGGMVGDTLMLEPSDAQVVGAFVEVGRREVAAKTGWPVEETRTIPEIARDKGSTDHIARGRAFYRKTMSSDSSGRVFCWSARTPITEEEILDEFLRDAPAHVQALERRYWIRMVDAMEKLRRNHTTIRRTLPTMSRPGLPVFVWVDPEAEKMLGAMELEDAVALKAEELGIPLDPADFMSGPAAQRLLSARFPGFSTGNWKFFQKKGRLISVRAKHPTRRGDVWHVHIPQVVRDTEDIEIAGAWLRGEWLSPVLGERG